MKTKRYGGFSDPIESDVIDESSANDTEEISEIEEVDTPIDFVEEKSGDPITEPMEEIPTDIDETQTIQRAIEPNATLVKVISDTLNIRTGPDFKYPATSLAKRGYVYELLEETNGWGRIDDNQWISLSKLFVERV